MPSIFNCCSTILEGFDFADIRAAHPPPQRGVYVLRVKQRGEPIPAIVEQVQLLTAKINWDLLTKKVASRIDRLWRIADCDTIYIGSAGTRSSSENTLLGRYGEFAGRHTAMYPIWALLAGGWELEYGWKIVQEAAQIEAAMKQDYRRHHSGGRPALVER